MKNWFIEKREQVVNAVLVALCCVMMVGFTLGGINELKNVRYEFDDGIEEIELTDEMVETYAALVRLGMEEWD